jgi:hypothetical protein
MSTSFDIFEHIKRVGVFKRLRPKTVQQAERFFYCEIAVPNTKIFLSGKSCSKRHIAHKAKYNKLIEDEASEIDFDIAGCVACGTCEFGALRASFLDERRKK